MSAAAGAGAGAAAGSVVPGIGTAIGAGVGALVGAAGSFFGQQSANKANKELQREANAFSAEQAQKQMDFQQYNSNTAYQRSMADMRQAGLNPMLAYQQGGASAPAGAQGSVQAAKVENAISPGVSSAIDAMRIRKEIKAVDSQIKLNEDTADKARADAGLSRAANTLTQTKQIAASEENKAIRAESIFRKKQADYDTDFIKYDNRQRRIDAGINTIGNSLNIVNPLKGMLGTSAKQYKRIAPSHNYYLKE